MEQTKGSNKIIIEKLNILFESLISSEDTKIYIMFLDKYFGFINKLPEFSQRNYYYLSERKKYFNKIKKVEEELSKEVDSELSRMSVVKPNLRRIKQTLKTNWGDQIDDIPCDGSALMDFYNEIRKGTGLQKYLTLKKFVEYINQNNEEIHSFACGIDFLSISEKCQRKYQEWSKKYYELNPEGQVWWSYQQIIKEKGKKSNEINLNELKKYVLTLHNDIKQSLLIGDSDIYNVVINKPSDIEEIGENNSGGYEITIGNKTLNFEDKTKDICRSFRYYYNNYGKIVTNKEISEYIGNSGTTINKLITTLRDKFKDNELNKRIILESCFKNSERGYKMTINPPETTNL